MEIRSFKPKCTHSLYIYTRVERQFTGLEIAIRPKFTFHTPKSLNSHFTHQNHRNDVLYTLLASIQLLVDILWRYVVLSRSAHIVCIYTRAERQFTGLEIAIRPKFTFHTPKSPQRCPLQASGFNSIVS